MRLTLEYEWACLGRVHMEEGRLRFPAADEIPGVYRLDLPERVYIGETDRLKRRFQQYRTPGRTQSTNIRLNRLLVEMLGSGVRPDVWIVTSASVEMDQQVLSLSLSDRSARLLVENAALTAERLAGRPVENL